MDQRNTLRRMLDGAGKPSADADLSAFKVDIVRALAPLSTGVLLDADYGVGAVRAAGALPAGTGLLVAAEPPVRAQWNGEPRATIDPGAMPPTSSATTATPSSSWCSGALVARTARASRTSPPRRSP